MFYWGEVRQIFSEQNKFNMSGKFNCIGPHISYSHDKHMINKYGHACSDG